MYNIIFIECAENWPNVSAKLYGAAAIRIIHIPLVIVIGETSLEISITMRVINIIILLLLIRSVFFFPLSFKRTIRLQFRLLRGSCVFSVQSQTLVQSPDVIRGRFVCFRAV